MREYRKKAQNVKEYSKIFKNIRPNRDSKQHRRTPVLRPNKLENSPH
jgi:hypothetical protein